MADIGAAQPGDARRDDGQPLRLRADGQRHEGRDPGVEGQRRKGAAAPAPGQGATASLQNDDHNVAPVAQASGGDTPQCQQHTTHYEKQCETCYAELRRKDTT